MRLETLAVILCAAAVLACGDESLMGFSAVPPRNDLPPDYCSRVVQGTALPVLVVEGRMAVDHSWLGRLDADGPGPLHQPGSILPLFTHLGLADSAMHAKPALTNWDAVFERTYRP